MVDAWFLCCSMSSDNKEIVEGKNSLTLEEKRTTGRVGENPSTNQDNKEDEKGIGLATVEKRLELLFKSSYTLNVNMEDNWYKVYLNIQNMN